MRSVRPSGLLGQVILEDIDGAVARAKQAVAAPKQKLPKKESIPKKGKAPKDKKEKKEKKPKKQEITGDHVTTEYGPAIAVKMDLGRKAMARVMTETAKIPHTGCIEDYYMDKFIQFRDSVKGEITKKYGVKISVTPFFMKAASLWFAFFFDMFF